MCDRHVPRLVRLGMALLIAATLAACGRAPKAPPARPPVAPSLPQWPDPRGPFLTGASPAAGPHTARLKWETKLPWPYVSSPAIGRDGTIYVASGSGPMPPSKAAAGSTLSAISSEGKVKWELSSEGADVGWGAFSSAALAADGTIYVARESGELLAVTPEGKVRWKAQFQWFWDGHAKGTPPWAPTVGPGGIIYTAGGSGLSAFAPDGTMKWQTKEVPFSRPVFGKEGTIHVGLWDTSKDPALSALTPDNQLRWHLPKVYGHQVVGSDGTIYAYSEPAAVCAVTPEGTVQWKLPLGDRDARVSLVRFISLGPDGTVHCIPGREGGEVWYAVSPQGRRVRETKLGEQVISPPLVTADGVVYLAGVEHCFAYDAQGRELWRLKVGQRRPEWPVPESALAADASGTLYISVYPGELMAVGR